MFDREEYQERLDAALDEPYFVDRLDKIQELEDDIAKQLKKHEVNKYYSAGLLTACAGLGVTVAAAVGGAVAVGWGAAIPILLTGSLGTALVLENAAKTGVEKKAAEKRYYKKNGDEIEALKDMKTEIKNARRAQIDIFRDMPAEQQAGLLKLENIVDISPEARNTLVNTFRNSVDRPVMEQGRPAQSAPSSAGSDSPAPSTS